MALRKDKLHTIKQAKSLLSALHVFVSPDAKLIGSFGKGEKTSMHDIDVYLPLHKTSELKQKLIVLLKSDKAEDTDWDGWYFSDTLYGNVDVFFSTDKFDY
jgi:hypothetical protein